LLHIANIIQIPEKPSLMEVIIAIWLYFLVFLITFYKTMDVAH
jgi:hypothetical protein